MTKRAGSDGANSSGSGPQGNYIEKGRGGNGSQSQAGNQSQFGQPFLSQQFHVPLAGICIPLPSLNIESTFPSPSGSADQQAIELPSNLRRLPTPEALGIVLRHAQRLLNDCCINCRAYQRSWWHNASLGNLL